MKILDIKEAVNPLAEYTGQVSKEPVVITVDGKPVAALVSLENADLETVMLSDNPDFLDIIQRSRLRLRAGEGIASDEVRRQLR